MRLELCLAVNLRSKLNAADSFGTWPAMLTTSDCPVPSPAGVLQTSWVSLRLAGTIVQLAPAIVTLPSGSRTAVPKLRPVIVI